MAPNVTIPRSIPRVIPTPNIAKLQTKPDGTLDPGAVENHTRTVEDFAHTVHQHLTPLFVDTGFVASAGWTLQYGQGRRMGSIVQIRVIVARTGGTIVVPASGIMGLIVIAVAPPQLQGSTTFAGAFCGGGVGRLTTGVYIPNTGSIDLACVSAGLNIVNGDSIELGGMVFVEDV